MTEQEKRRSSSDSAGSIENTKNLLHDFGAAPKKQSPPPATPKPASMPSSSEAPVEKKPEARADNKTKKASGAPKKSASASKEGAKRSSTHTKVKSESTKEKASSGRTQTSTADPTTPKKGKKTKAESNDDTPRSSKPAHRILPFVLILLAVFILVSLILNLLCNWNNKLGTAGTPESHWMGLFGYYLCYWLFGLFGPAVFVLPFLVLNLAFFWKRYVDNRVTISKIVVSILFLLLLSATIHVICLPFFKQQYPDHDLALSASELISSGVLMTGGGLFGGKLGYLMYLLLKVPGTLILSPPLLALGLFYILGMTPQNLWNSYRARRASRNAEREKSKESDDKGKDEEEKEKSITETQKDVEDKRDAYAPPKKGAQPTEETPPKKNPDAKLAPMPLPKLDPNDGSTLFVPRDVNQKMREEQAARIAAKRAAASAPPTPPPTTPTPPPTESQAKSDFARNRDAAVDPIFPKSPEARAQRKTPKAERNFDLRNVFIDLDDETDKQPPPQRKHAPVPPEVPLSPAPKKTASSVSGAPQRPTSPNGTAAGASSAQRATPKPTAAGTAPKAPPISSVKPSPSSATPVKKDSTQPIFRQADNTKKKEFGLSSEEFEKLEAERAGTPQRAGTKPPLKTDSKAPVGKESAGAKKDAGTKPASPKKYVFPPISYLQPGEPMTAENRAEIQASMKQLAETLTSFRVRVQEINYSCGPTVTRYEVILAPGVRVSTIKNLSDDIALALRSSGGVRIEAPIPGTNAVGIEVPNKTRSTIYLRDMIESKEFSKASSKLAACLGADIAGDPIIFDIAKMPHLLVAGTTGSGKSVCINCIVMSLLYKVRPDEVKLIMIDPKKVEFSIYKNIPHLMAPVVTTPKDAAGALQAAVEEMERRFELFETVGVRDIKGYNSVTADDPDMPYLPHIVIIIDELADLMMTAKNEVETAICRIAQKARAAGMHLIIGTQRPSADVVTGLIKANVPSSIAFAVKSQVDSRVILDHGGAEALTGRGDMLFVPIGAMRDTRVQGAFVDDKEVEKICEFIRATNGTAQYDEKFISKLKELAAQCGNKGKSNDDLPPPADGEKADDPKYADAVRVAIEEGRISTSLLQRKLEVGYSRAAKLIDRMQSEGIVSPPDGSKPRSILISKEQYFEKFFDNAEDGQ